MAFTKCFNNYIAKVLSKDDVLVDEEQLRTFVKNVEDKVRARAQNILEATAEIPEGKKMYMLKDRNRAYTQALDEIIEDLRISRARAITDAEAQISFNEFLSQNIGKYSSKGLAFQYMNNVYSRSNGEYARLINNELAELVELGRSKMPGFGADMTFKSKNGRDLMLELHGGNSGNATAKKMSGLIKDIRHKYIEQLRAMGVNINELDNYGISHVWDPLLVQRAGKDVWVSKMYNAVKDEQIRTRSGRIMTNEEKLKALEEDWWDITTGRKIEHGRFFGTQGRSMNSQLNKPRIWRMGDPKKASEMVLDYGMNRNVYESITNELMGLVHDVELVKSFGNQVDHNFKLFKDQVKKLERKELQEQGKLKGSRISNPMTSLDSLWDELTGSAYRLQEGDNAKRAQEFANTVTNSVAALYNGMASIASIGDFPNMIMRSKMWGGSFSKLVGPELESLNKQIKMFGDDIEGRAIARAGSIAVDDALAGTYKAGRFEVLEVTGKASLYASKAADITNRVSGLSFITRVHENAMHSFFKSRLAQMSKEIPYQALPEDVFQTMQLYGITRQDWENLAKASDGLRLNEKTIPDETASRLYGMLYEEVRNAVARPGLEARAVRRLGAKSGETGHVVGSLLFSLKGFFISNMLNQIRTTLIHPMVKNRMGYFVQRSIYAVLFGGASTQLYQMAQGRDMMDPTSFDFFLQSISRGSLGYGSEGLVMAFADAMRGKASTAYNVQRAAGPAISLLYDLFLGTGKNLGTLLFGEEEEKRAAVADMIEAGNKLPVSNAAWLNLAAKRLLWEQVAQVVNPERRRMYKDRERRLKGKTGQQYYWPQGKAGPERAPEIAEAPE